MGIFGKKTLVVEEQENVKNVIKVEGNTDDLLDISRDGSMKQTRLFVLPLPENPEEDNAETLDLCITSTNPYHSFPIFDELMGKKIRITVDVIEE